MNLTVMVCMTLEFQGMGNGQREASLHHMVLSQPNPYCIGGRGRLTDKTVDSLQVYYGKAIRENTHDIGAMHNAIMAIWHHTQATDDNPDHDLCPPGEHSWCCFQRDQENGTTDYSHKHPLPAAVAKAILPSFEALSDRDLLRRS